MALIYLAARINALGLGYLAWECAQGKRNRGWPQTTGMVLQSNSVPLANNKKEKVVNIQYRYSVDGKDYLSR